jgi:class 3 adenylate cyclase/tetratricopeptide (TPR) repeat protein
MQCPRCQRDNRAERRFCSGCGAELRQVCSRCGFANDPADQFCGGCGTSLAGTASVVDLQRSAPPDLRASAPRAYTPRHLAEKILTSRIALEGERKQVTVLFVDVSGFTSLSEKLDPEDVHRVMARAFELMLDEVHRYEGTVNQFLGDGIMALFGAPIAHEDHAQRAVHAALGVQNRLETLRQDLQRERGLQLTVRQGLNTGLVVVGSIGSDLRMDYTAVGDTTNVAARLQQAADPGRIVISEGTHRLVSGYFHLRPLGPLTLKGKTETISDRLEEAPKRTLQVAAVIGREFTQRLLARLADIQARTEDYVRTLKALELIYEKRLFPELAFMFKHALTHDVAYNSLLVQRRRELHYQIARAVEELYADRITEQYEILAHHYSRAEDWPKALEYLLRAAEKATQGYANLEALALYDQALEAVRHLGAAVSPTTRILIHRAKVNLHALLSDFRHARAEGQRFLELAREAGDRSAEALAALGLWSLYDHEFEPALIYARDAMAVAGLAGVGSALAQAHFTTGMIHTVNGRLAEGHSQLERTIAISRSEGDAFHQSLALSMLGMEETWAGASDSALALQTQSLRLAREHNLALALFFAFFGNGITRATRGEYEASRALLQEGLVLSERIGDEIWQHRFLNCLGWLHTELGDLQTALELNRRGAEGARKRGDPETQANAQINVGDILVLQGDLALAGELLDEVLKMVEDRAVSAWQKWRYSTHLFASLSEPWLARGDVVRAREFVDRCLEVATRTTSRKYVAWGWRLTGDIARVGRHWDQAVRALGEAMTTARGVGNPTQLWKTHVALGRLPSATGRRREAAESYRSAREILERMKLGLRDEALGSSLERSPVFREVYDLSGPV